MYCLRQCQKTSSSIFVIGTRIQNKIQCFQAHQQVGCNTLQSREKHYDRMSVFGLQLFYQWGNTAIVTDGRSNNIFVSSLPRFAQIQQLSCRSTDDTFFNSTTAGSEKPRAYKGDTCTQRAYLSAKAHCKSLRYSVKQHARKDQQSHSCARLTMTGGKTMYDSP